MTWFSHIDFVSEEAMAMSFDDGLNTPPPDYEEAVKNMSDYWSKCVKM